jgi:hypothetical protein
MNATARPGTKLVAGTNAATQSVCDGEPKEMTMRKTALYALIGLVGLASGAADAAIATFHCDAAPVEQCHYVVFDNTTPRPVAIVQGGQSLVVNNVRGTDTYCRAVGSDPDTSTCSHQPVPLDADFHDRVDTSNHPAGSK